jgi:hypothetical protein
MEQTLFPAQLQMKTNEVFFFPTWSLRYIKSFKFKAYKEIEHLKLVNNKCYCTIYTIHVLLQNVNKIFFQKPGTQCRTI